MATRVLSKDDDKLRPRHFVNISRISAVTDPSNILFDSRVLEPPDRVLVEKIDREGFTTALLVRPDGEDYGTIDGRRRRAAARELVRIYAEHGVDRDFTGPISVPDSVFGEMTLHGRGLDRAAGFVGVFVEVVNVSDAEAFDLMIGANESAKPYTDLQRAALIQRATEIAVRVDGVYRVRTLAEACKPFNLSSSQGGQLLKLLRTDDIVQARVDSGEMQVSAAAALSELPREQQRQVVAEADAAGQKVTTNRAKMAARPDGPMPASTRQQVCRFIFDDRASWKQASANLDNMKALFGFFATGEKDVFSYSPRMERLVEEVTTAVKEKRKPKSVEAVTQFDEE